MFQFASITRLMFGAMVSTAFMGAPFAIAHEEHHMECDETGVNAMNADIQAMNESEAKTTAMTEMKMAEEMLAKKDMKSCETHMHNAMEAMEK